MYFQHCDFGFYCQFLLSKENKVFPFKKQKNKTWNKMMKKNNSIEQRPFNKNLKWNTKTHGPIFEFVTMDPFTNQPYAFDDSGVSADPREVEFNNGIREITVCYIVSLCQRLWFKFQNLCILPFDLDFGYGWMRSIRCRIWPSIVAQKIWSRRRRFSTHFLGRCHCLPNQLWNMCIFIGG